MSRACFGKESTYVWIEMHIHVPAEMYIFVSEEMYLLVSEKMYKPVIHVPVDMCIPVSQGEL